MSRVNSKTGALDLDHQDQIGLQTSKVFEQKNLLAIIIIIIKVSSSEIGDLEFQC